MYEQKKFEKKKLIFFSIFNSLKSPVSGKEMSGFRILKIWRTSRPDMMSGRALQKALILSLLQLESLRAWDYQEGSTVHTHLLQKDIEIKSKFKDANILSF